MKTKYFAWLGIVIILLIVAWYWGTSNSIITKEEGVNTAWAQVQTQYQRRIDLIPNLVSSAKGYMQFEKTTLEDITRLRSQWQAATTTQDKIATANELEGTLSKLLIVYENYPELKSDEIIRPLMDELAGTENRISVERNRYNTVVQEYNLVVRRFPSSIVAGMMGMSQKTYFQATSDDVPKVDLV